MRKTLRTSPGTMAALVAGNVLLAGSMTPAVAQVTIQPGETIVLSGTVHISSPIVVPSSGTLAGDGTAVVINHGAGPAVIIAANSSFATVRNIRIEGGDEQTSTAGILTLSNAIRWAISVVSITKHLDGLVVGESNAYGRIVDAVSYQNRRHGFDIGQETGYQGFTLMVVDSISAENGSYGMIFRNQHALNAGYNQAQNNVDGGILFRRVSGRADNLTTVCAPGPVGMWWVSSRMTVINPTTSGCTWKYQRDGGSVNIINSELNYAVPYGQ